MAESKYIGSGGSDSLKKLVELIKSRVVPISKGGTGATTAKAAEYAILGKIEETSVDELYDDTQMLFKTALASPSNGVTRTAQAVKMSRYILKKVFPVGAVYISYNNTSPASLFGGTWTPITGRFPYFNAGTATGGSNSLALTQAQMPEHTHLPSRRAVVQGTGGNSTLGTGSGFASYGYLIDQGKGQDVKPSQSAGSAATFNNMPAYQTLYAWRRTA